MSACHGAHHQNILAELRRSPVFQSDFFRGDKREFHPATIPLQEALDALTFFAAALILPELGNVVIGRWPEHAQHGPTPVRMLDLVIAMGLQVGKRGKFGKKGHDVSMTRLPGFGMKSLGDASAPSVSDAAGLPDADGRLERCGIAITMTSFFDFPESTMQKEFSHLIVALVATLSLGAGTAQAQYDQHAQPFTKEVDAFHSVLAPLWHTPAGAERSQEVCAQAATLEKLAKEIPGAKAQPLVASVSALMAQCQTKPSDIDAPLTRVHQAFHRLIESR